MISCGGDPKVPGETAQNPLKFSVGDYASKTMKIDKKYLSIKGVPLTMQASFTYTEGKEASIENAENFYFPLVPVGFDPQKDTLSIFAYTSVAKFNEITKNKTELIEEATEEKTIIGTKSDYLYIVPGYILDVYTKDNIKIAPEDKRITIKLESIQ